MSRYITLQQLIDAGACKEQCGLFAKKFGERVRVTQKLCRGVATDFSWDGAAVRLLSGEALDQYKQAVAPARANYRGHPSMWAEYRRAVAPLFAKAYNGDKK